MNPRESPKRAYIDAEELEKLFRHKSWPILMERTYDDLAQALLSWTKTASSDASFHAYWQGYIRRLLDDIAIEGAMARVKASIDVEELKPEDKAERVYPWMHAFFRFLGKRDNG